MELNSETKIKYTIEDDGKTSSFVLTMDQIEKEELYTILHDAERYTCLAKIVNREVVIDKLYDDV